MSKLELILSVDVDDTIFKCQYPEIGPFRIGAPTVLKWLINRNHKVFLNTCREHPHLKEDNRSLCLLEKDSDKCLLCPALSELYKNRIWNIAGVNQNHSKLIRKYGDCRKISADWYFDDKAGFLGWWSVPMIVLWLEWKYRKGGNLLG